MRDRNMDARPYQPLLALTIAAIAAVGAISQSGLLLDAATASRGGADRATVQAVSRTPDRPTERPHVAAAQRIEPSPDAARPN